MLLRFILNNVIKDFGYPGGGGGGGGGVNRKEERFGSVSSRVIM